MNNDIKEKIKAYYVNNDIDEILDYITNLQNKIKDLEDTIIDKHECIEAKNDTITNLQEERDMYKGGFETMSKNYFEEKSRNEKAIEHIKNNWYSKNTRNIDELHSLGDWRLDLLNILGEDNE